MRIDRFTNSLQLALADAQSMAVGKNHAVIEPAHLLLAMLNQDSASTRPILAQAGGDVAALQAALEQRLDNVAVLQQATGEVGMSPQTAKLLNLADKFAQDNGDQYIATEAVLGAALQSGSELQPLFAQAGFTREKGQQAIRQGRGGGTGSSAGAGGNRHALEK